MNIELRHLRYFVAVAEELHFGRRRAPEHFAAAAQPANSDPEQQIGARLLARTNRSVSLTAAGRQFLADSRQILSMVDDAAARAERLYLGKPVNCASGLPRLPRLSAPSRKPCRRFAVTSRTHIQTREINTREQIAPLNEGALDLGLMRNTQLPDSLAWQVILREPLMAMIPRDHRRRNLPSRWRSWRKSRLSFRPAGGNRSV